MSVTQPPETAAVVQRAYDFSLWLLPKVEKFPRSYRFTVGERLVAGTLTLLESLVEAAYTTQKGALLEAASRKANSLRFHLRLAADLQLLSRDSQAFAATRLEEIGRMIGGWRKHIGARP